MTLAYLYFVFLLAALVSLFDEYVRGVRRPLD